MLGDNVVVKGGAVLERAVVHDNVFVGPQVGLRGCVVGKNTDVMRAARIEEGAVVGDECVVEEEAYLADGVKVYPFKTIEAGAVVHTSVIWESRGSSSLFGPRGVSGLVNVEITPEFVVRLASAYATTLPKGSTVDHGPGRLAGGAGAQARRHLGAHGQRDRRRRTSRSPRCRSRASRPARPAPVGGVVLRTSPGDPESIDIVFLDADGADLSPARQRALERVVSRQEFRRAFPGEIAELYLPLAHGRDLRPGAAAHHRRPRPRGRGHEGRARHRRAAPCRWSCPRCSAASASRSSPSTTG